MLKKLMLLISAVTVVACSPTYYDVDWVLGQRIGVKYSSAEKTLPSIEENDSPIYQEQIINDTAEYGALFKDYVKKVSLVTGNVFEIESKVGMGTEAFTNAQSDCERTRYRFSLYMAKMYNRDLDVDLDSDVQFISTDGTKTFSMHCINEDGEKKLHMRLVAVDELDKINAHLQAQANNS